MEGGIPTRLALLTEDDLIGYVWRFYRPGGRVVSEVLQFLAGGHIG